MMGRITSAAAILMLLSGACASPLQAQDCNDGGLTRISCLPEASRTSGELLTLGANVAIGGLTAGVRQWRADGSFLDGFWRGAVGGVGTYAGKRIVGADFDGAGILGRSVAAAGASVTRNAADGKPMFDRLTIPIGFVRLDWRPHNGDVHAAFDVAALTTIAGIYMSGLGASLDLRRTLDTGAPVFMARDWEPGLGWAGRQIFGAVLLRGDPPVDPDHAMLLRQALHHERVHVLQYDQSFILWNEPFETRLLRRLGSPDWLASRFDLSLVAVGISGMKFMLPPSLHVWEDEAHFIGRTEDGPDGA
ncbi:MAG TPA: hypothetical protein VHG09_13035 [Longimicrobiales bacterium]|nr:hypothetical protein [Longimicrobiales bacterium]